jgi:hypothetical protein
MEESDELLQNLLDEEEPQYEADDGALTENQLEQILNDIRTKKLH